MFQGVLECVEQCIQMIDFNKEWNAECIKLVEINKELAGQAGIPKIYLEIQKKHSKKHAFLKVCAKQRSI